MAKRHSNLAGNLESLFLRLEELVLANSGADEFDEIFKLIIAKLWDERVYGGTRFRSYETDEKTFAVIEALIREASSTWQGILDPLESPSLTPTHLSICVEALAPHQLFNSGFEVMDSFFEFTISKSSKGSKGQFFTPRYVIEMCIRMISPKANETLVDPACGSGGFLFHTLQYIKKTNNYSSDQISKYTKERLWGFDIDRRAIRVAKALMLLAGDGCANIVRANSLLHRDSSPKLWDAPGDKETHLTIEDIIRTRLRNHGGFDVIATNPPFAGEIREQNILNHYLLAKGKTRIERDVLFVERCIDLLRPGGRLAIVLPHNKFAAESFRFLREWLLKKTRVLGVVSLGRHTFLPHTHQKASVLFAQKLNGSMRGPQEPIFFAVSERDGKNSRGQLLWRAANKGGSYWENVDHDLEEIETQFNEICNTGMS